MEGRVGERIMKGIDMGIIDRVVMEGFNEIMVMIGMIMIIVMGVVGVDGVMVIVQSGGSERGAVRSIQGAVVCVVQMGVKRGIKREIKRMQC